MRLYQRIGKGCSDYATVQRSPESSGGMRAQLQKGIERQVYHVEHSRIGHGVGYRTDAPHHPPARCRASRHRLGADRALRVVPA